MPKPILLIALLALSGCVTLPELKWPTFDTPTPAVPSAAESTPVAVHLPADWWRAYGDPALDALMAEALAHNADLRLAAARVDEARAQWALAEGTRRPYVEASLGASRTRSTELGKFPAPTPIGNSFQAGVQAAYELDWWGRYRQASAAARADLLASQLGQDVVLNGLAVTVATTWFTLRSLDAQLNLADQTLANRREWLALQRLRQQVGEASEYELSLAEAELASVEAGRAGLVRSLALNEHALAALTGRTPRQQAEERPARGNAMPGVPEVPAGLPSDLLARRPDIRQAEARLTAAEARIAEAKAAIYPNLTLTANLGSESKSLSDLFSGPATVWGLAANLAQTLYNAGRTEAAMDAAVARRTQALIEYEQTVRNAFRETLDALVAVRQARAQAEASQRRVEAQRRAAELADLRHRNGAASHIEVLDAQRDLYGAEQDRLNAELARLTASADLFKALGGGWQPDATP